MTASSEDDVLQERSLRLHVKILVDPSAFTVHEMLDGIREVYRAARIRVDLVSTERLSLPHLEDLDAGECRGGAVTAEQEELFGYRDGVEPGDVVVYFVRSTVPPYSGCAAHPEECPGAVVVSRATRWTLAHEVGHVLGLRHVADSSRLMTGGGTAKITNPVPDLSAVEVAAMRASPLVRQVNQ